MTRWLFASIAMTAVALVAALYLNWAQPTAWFLDEIPVHWDINMKPDRSVPVGEFLPILYLFPGLMALMTVLQIALPWLSPKNFEIEPFIGVFGYVMTVLAGFFGLLMAMQIWAAMQENVWFPTLFIASFFVLFGLMGNVMGKIRRNFFMGIKTPWTLASEVVWNRTHRLAAWLWFAMGVVGAVLTLAGVPFWVSLVVLIVAVLCPVIYSLVLYKRLERAGQLFENAR